MERNSLKRAAIVRAVIAGVLTAILAPLVALLEQPWNIIALVTELLMLLLIGVSVTSLVREQKK